MPLIDHFPQGYTPRDGQTQILNKIDECISAKQKFIVLESPTGTGKSHIAATISNYSDDCNNYYRELVDSNHIFDRNENGSGYKYAEDVSDLPRWGTTCLTVTKQLQDQYNTIFKQAALLKGRNDYICEIDNDFTVDVAPCTYIRKQLKSCISQDVCPYFNSLKYALTNKFSVLNYSKYLTTPKFVRGRQFLICDEASEVEDMIVSHYSLNINYKQLAYQGIQCEKIVVDSYKSNYNWISNLSEEIESVISNHQARLGSSSIPKREKKGISQKLQYCKGLKEKVSIVLAYYDKCEYICQYNSDTCSFTPLYTNELAHNIWRSADYVILMSGTIFDHKTFTRTLGINDYEFVEVDSEFDKDKNPIYVPGTYKLNHANQDTVLPKIVDQALEICEEYDDKGIIHTHTNKITNAVKSKVKKDDRFLFRVDGVKNEHILTNHIERDDATVLVSPSMAFGVDLKDELGRFQIIMKLPFPTLGDKRIKTLFERDKKWYIMKMFVKLIQMSGRTSRTKEDYSSTYILDGTAVDIIKREWNNLPAHFRDRLR